MRMLKVKDGKNTYQYRLDWLVVWNLIHIKQHGKNPERWENVFLFVEDGYYKPNKNGSNTRANHQIRFEFDTEAEAMAAVSIVDI